MLFLDLLRRIKLIKLIKLNLVNILIWILFKKYGKIFTQIRKRNFLGRTHRTIDIWRFSSKGVCSFWHPSKKSENIVQGQND